MRSDSASRGTPARQWLPGIVDTSARAPQPRRPRRAAVAAIAFLLCAPIIRAADFSEPGFETPVLGAGTFDYDPNAPTAGQSAWTYLGASGLTRPPSAFTALDAAEGSQIAFLQTFGSGSSSAVCQNVAGLAVGVEHFLAAKLELRVGCISCVGPADVQFQLDGNVIFTVAGADIPAEQFKQFVAIFTPPASTLGQLCIVEPPEAGLGDVTNFVDDAHVGILGIFSDSFEPFL